MKAGQGGFDTLEAALLQSVLVEFGVFSDERSRVGDCFDQVLGSRFEGFGIRRGRGLFELVLSGTHLVHQSAFSSRFLLLESHDLPGLKALYFLRIVAGGLSR